MNGSYLLDTNVVIGLFRGEENVLTELTKAAQVFLPSIVLGELYYGAEKSSRSQQNVRKIDEFTVGRVILDCDMTVAREYGSIKSQLHRKGQPLPENDIWIAAIARTYTLTLATRDVHFRSIENLRTESW